MLTFIKHCSAVILNFNYEPSINNFKKTCCLLYMIFLPCGSFPFSAFNSFINLNCSVLFYSYFLWFLMFMDTAYAIYKLIVLEIAVVSIFPVIIMSISICLSTILLKNINGRRQLLNDCVIVNCPIYYSFIVTPVMIYAINLVTFLLSLVQGELNNFFKLSLITRLCLNDLIFLSSNIETILILKSNVYSLPDVSDPWQLFKKNYLNCHSTFKKNIGAMQNEILLCFFQRTLRIILLTYLIIKNLHIKVIPLIGNKMKLVEYTLEGFWFYWNADTLTKKVI